MESSGMGRYLLGMVDFSPEQWRQLIIYFIVMMVVGVFLTIVVLRAVGSRIAELMGTDRGRRSLLGSSAVIVLVVAVLVVASVVADDPRAWMVLGGVVLIGGPLGMLLIAALDDSDDDPPDTMEGMGDVPSIWR